MTQEEILEGNSAIAEFMGVGYNKYGHENWLRVLCYHTSWDWLMPVVDKIEKDNDYYFEIQRYWINVYRFNDRSGLIVKTGTFTHSRDKLCTVWLTVVELIKYLNKHK